MQKYLVANSQYLNFGIRKGGIASEVLLNSANSYRGFFHKVLTTLMIAIPKQWLYCTQFFIYRDTEHWVTNLSNALGNVVTR